MSTGTRIGVLLGIALAIIVALGTNAYISIQRLLETNRSVAHTHLVHEQLEKILALHSEAETGERGYVLTGEPRYLEPYAVATGLIKNQIASARELTRDNPDQQQTLQRVQALSEARLAELKQTIDIRNQSGMDAAVQAIRTNRGRQIMDDLRGLIDQMKGREQALLEIRNDLADASASRMALALGIWTPLSLLILAAFALAVLRRVRFDDRPAPAVPHRRRLGRLVWHYSFAAATVAIAALLRWWLVGAVGPLPTFVTFYPAVLITASVAGGGPGIFCALLGALVADYFFIAPYGSFVVTAPNDLLGLAIFTASNVFLCLLAERLQRARRAEAVAAEKELMAVTLASIGDGVIVSDTRGRVTFLNDEAERLTGWKSVEATGRPMSEVFKIINEETRQTVESPVDKVLRLGTVVGLANHTILVAKDGRETPIDDSGAPVRERGGSVQGVVLVFRDFSEQKAAERERKRGEEALQAARISAERAKADAETASKAKDHFLAVLSHELRTPLTPALTTANLLIADSQLPGRYRDDIDMIRRNVELEARLIDDLLDVTRITRGKLELDLKPVELCQVIKRAVEVCQPDIEARRLEFCVDPGPGAPYLVHADPARLQQVFWNLVKNAIKFTPGGGCVGVRCRLLDGHVIAEVNDSGQGIEPAALPHIFNAFEQGDRRITRQFGGLGLGLTISKAIVEMHEGTITASSDGPGKGATFAVRLPVIVKTDGKRPAEPPVVKHERLSAPLRILLVEDHGDTAHMMARLLRQYGHQVKMAGDVATALQALSDETFDLLISDLGLPDGSGADLMRTLRSRGSAMPGIALSGYGQDEDVRRSIESGFAAHLIKPTTPARLAQAIAQVAGNGVPSAK